MELNFQDLYKSQTVTIADVLEVTVQEVENGKFIELQSKFLGDVSLGGDKKDMERQMQSKRINIADYNAAKVLLGIREWKYKGDAFPVSMENWKKLPKSITDQIEKAVGGLNPEMDEDFQD